MAARSYYTDRRVALGLKVRIEEATSTFKLDTYNVRTNGDGKRAGDYLVPVLLTLVGVSSPSFQRKTPAFTPMGHGSLSPFGMHPYYCTLALPPPTPTPATTGVRSAQRATYDTAECFTQEMNTA